MIRVGTFNLNNLFSRFNFAGVVSTSPSVSNGGIEISFAEGEVAVRTFMGKLVKEKAPADTARIGARILQAMNADVLAVQEVEHLEILREFNVDYLGGAYSEVALIEGNDPRLIDVGVLSKLPIGGITSHQTARHPARPDQRVFGRDLLQVEILDAAGDRLFTLYNTHMKSHYVPFDQDPVAGAAAANERRLQQAETIARIVSRQQRRGSRFILTGDMNDPPGSPFLAPMLTVDGDDLTNGLTNAVETRPAKPDSPTQGPGPATTNWTHRYNPPGPAFPQYEQYDQIWLSPALAPKLLAAGIDRRTRHGGDGSDHDPAWIDLAL